MKKVVFITVALVMILSSCTSIFSERSLSKFADPKAEYAMLLQGEVIYEGDTVKFDLVPAVQFSLDRHDCDELVIISKNGSSKFYRGMKSFYNVPNPDQKGKSMNGWNFTTANKSSGLSKKESLEIFQKVVNNGSITYNGFRNKKALKTNFIRTYKKSEDEASRLTEVVSQPIFSKRKI